MKAPDFWCCMHRVTRRGKGAHITEVIRQAKPPRAPAGECMRMPFPGAFLGKQWNNVRFRVTIQLHLLLWISTRYVCHFASYSA